MTTEFDPGQPVENITGLVAYLESGCKLRPAWRIGSEHEKFAFTSDDLRPLPYEGVRSIRAMLEGMRDRFGWKEIRENGHIIALQRDGASITLEPGGQFELSGAPLDHVHQTCAEVQLHLREVRAVADDLNIAFLGLGFSPLWTLDETPRMPKGRYAIMESYMKRVGRLGQQMMFRSATVQVNLDFGSEADMVRKMRLGLALQPLAAALFANSPFAEGRTNGFLSYRSHAWTDTDPDRTGMLPMVFEDGFGFERYVDYAISVPMYFVRRGGRYIDCSGQSFARFLRGELAALPGEKPRYSDFTDHLSTMFPEVRLKTFIEMRGADAGPWSRLCALPAFWVGLLYDEQALSEALDLVQDWTAAERETIRRAVPVLGLKTPVRGGSLQDIAKQVLTICRAGLQRRAHSAEGDTDAVDESCFLTELEDIVGSGITPAGTLLDLYHGRWQGDIRPVFTHCAY